MTYPRENDYQDINIKVTYKFHLKNNNVYKIRQPVALISVKILTDCSQLDDRFGNLSSFLMDPNQGFELLRKTLYNFY